MRLPVSFPRIASVARKEIYHILRDPFTLALALGLPMIMVAVFGLAIEFNMREIRLAVFDGDKTESSRTFVEIFGSSNYFKVRQVLGLPGALKMLEREEAKASLIINPGFENSLQSGQGAKAQMLLDGADNSTVGVILGYVSGIQKLANERMSGVVSAPVTLQTRYLYNAELDSQWFVIPGLMVVILSILSILLTTLTVAREWENGSMELLLSTPVRPIEIIIGKLLPYVILALLALVFVYGVARLGFSVPFRGSHFLLIFSALLFLSAYLAQGLVISVVTRKQQVAMQIGMVAGLLPSLLLSGFVFPVESMPKFFHYFTMIFPARWFMVIARSLFLKGASLDELLQPLLGLTILTLLLVSAATRLFKKDVEP